MLLQNYADFGSGDRHKFLAGASSAGNVAAHEIHVKGAGAPTIRLEDSDENNYVYDISADEATGFQIQDITSTKTIILLLTI